MGLGTLAILEPETRTPALTYSREAIGEVIGRADQLGRQHWRELYGETAYVADLAKISALDDFAYFVARTAEGVTVGHAGFFLIASPFHGATVAMDAFYYVLPGHRRFGAASGLLRHAAEDLKAHGLSEVLVSRMDGTSLGPMIESAGFRHSSHVYRFGGA